MTPPEKEKALERIDKLATENNELSRQMRRIGFQIDPNAARDMRMEILIDTLLGKGEDSSARVKFELRVQEAMNVALTKTLKQAQSKSRLRKLHVPGQSPNGVKS